MLNVLSLLALGGGGEELQGEPFFLSPAAHSSGTGCVNQGCKEGSLGFHHHIICRGQTFHPEAKLLKCASLDCTSTFGGYLNSSGCIILSSPQ